MSRPQFLVPACTAAVLGGVTAAVLRRMEHEYADRDTLSPRTVAAMYATYGAHAGALGWAASRRIWPVPLPPRAARATGVALLATGSAAALAGAGPFGVGKQLSGIEAGTLHASGLYRYSRNPQYLGLGLVVTGLATATRSGFTGLLAAGVWATYRRWIPAEEQHLTRVFGTRYLDYRHQVRRWLGIRHVPRSSRPQRGAGGDTVAW